MSIGKRIKQFAETAFEDVAEFAAAFGWKPAGLYKYFSGDREPGAPMLSKLYEMGCDINWILSGNGEMFANNQAGQLLKEKINLKEAEKDRAANIQQSIEESRVIDVRAFPQAAGEAIESYDRLKAAATPKAPATKKKKGK